LALVIFVVCLIGLLRSTPSQPERGSESSEQDTSTFKLELLSSTATREYDFIIVEGEVKNICTENLEHVQVVVRFYTSDGDFVKSEDALIKYDPILAGQTSPWKIIATDNPEIKKYIVEFKEFLGGTIPTKDSRE